MFDVFPLFAAALRPVFVNGVYHRGHDIIIVRVYIVVYCHTGISLQPYTELRNIYFKMQKKNLNVQFN